MAIITDPDDLNQNTEIVINPTDRVFSLKETGNLSSDGVTLQAIYSFFKEEWKDDATLIPIPFALESITTERFEFINGWRPSGDPTRKLIRTAGWSELSGDGTKNREYAGIISLGTVGTGDQPYYYQFGDSSIHDFEYAGQVNEAIQIFGDAGNGDFSFTTFLNIYVREQGKIYSSVNLDSIGVSTMINQVYRFPLTNSLDSNITGSDATIETQEPWTNISISYLNSPVSKTIGTGNFLFDKIISGNNASLENIYEKIQFLLRQNYDIDTGSNFVTGKVTGEALDFIGDNLRTRKGVYIEDFLTTETNRLQFTDISGEVRTFPFVAAGTITFNNNLQNDTDAKYWMFFSSVPSGDYGTISGVIVDDNNDNDITGFVNGQASVTFDFDYDNNVQGGRTAATNAPVTLVAIGLSTGQYVSVEGTISRSSANSFNLIAPFERNYLNE